MTAAPLLPDIASGEHGADPFFTWLFMQAGMRARHYRPGVLLRRLPACLRALRVADIEHARRLLRRNERLIPVALDALLLGVTEFFRDTQVFECLERELRLVAENQRPLRVWSAGCSDGAELYSLAILLSELNLLDRCELRGTDCRHDAIARATVGAYKTPAISGVSFQRLARHFQSTRTLRPDDPIDWRVEPALRERITWRRADLLAGVEPGPWDMILCRNLAMYLEPVAAERLWRGLVSVLRPGGLVALGTAERPPVAARLHPAGPCVYRRCGEA